MAWKLRELAAVGTALGMLAVGSPAIAQKQGGILKLYMVDSPASMSIHEESTIYSERPMMGVFNNLVMFDQHVRQNSLNSIVPDLATGWSWDEDGTRLTFKLREGVKWHDGKPFTAKDVKCTWDLLTGRASEKFRINPRRAWYHNLDEVLTDGDHTVTFRLKRTQPAFLILLASGFSPVYPCHVAPRDMRQRPIGTGPFKFVEFKPNESIKVARNPDYWKPGRPYLDGIEYTIVKNRSTAILAFVAGKYDLTFGGTLTIPLTKDLQSQVPEAVCEMNPGSVNVNVIINRDAPPFDNPDLRRAIALSVDRQAFIDILTEGKGNLGGAMQPPPEGLWGMPPELLQALPGFDRDVEKNREQARLIMKKLGYGPDRPLRVKVTTRDIPSHRDPAVILIDQLKQIHVDSELETIDTTNWFPKIIRRDYAVGVNLTGAAVDDPDQTLYGNFSCGAEANYTGYCSAEFDRLIDRQSVETNQEQRKALVWQIERKLAEDGARLILYYTRGGICWRPHVKDLTVMTNSIFNGWRMEDVWLDK